jgi:hypothetical protein
LHSARNCAVCSYSSPGQVVHSRGNLSEKSERLFQVTYLCLSRLHGCGFTPVDGFIPHTRKINSRSNCDSFAESERLYLAQSVSKVVSQKSIPTQIRQRILYIGNSKG